MEWERYDEYFREVTKKDKDYLAYMKFDKVDMGELLKFIENHSGIVRKNDLQEKDRSVKVLFEMEE